VQSIIERSSVGKGVTYSYVVLQLNSPRRVEVNLLQSLPHDIVRLTLALLGGFDSRGLVEVSLVVDVEFTEGVGKAKDLILLELRIFPG
jgi:hypothetical protein